MTAALEHHYDAAAARPTVVIDDPLGAALDVIGFNEYVGWYDGLPEKCDRLLWRTAFEKPLVISELGADAKAGLHGDALTRFTEEYQASFYRHQLVMLRTIPTLRGMSPWILVDFRSPRRPLPDAWNRKGRVANDGTKKQAFTILRDAYRARAAAGKGGLGQGGRLRSCQILPISDTHASSAGGKAPQMSCPLP